MEAGRSHGSWANPGTTSSYNNTILFTGRELDSETGLQLNRRRYYHNTLGKWINRDPIGYLSGPHLYEYVASNSLVAFDPYGLKQVDYPCRLPTNPNTIFLSFQDCSPKQQNEIAARMCDAAQSIKAADSDVSIVNQLFGKGEPVLEEHRKIMDRVLPCLNKWFADPGPADGTGMKVIGTIEKNPLEVVSSTLLKTSLAFDSRIGIECECNDCGSKTAYVYDSIFGTDIHLCNAWWKKSNARKVAILSHELSHEYAFGIAALIVGIMQPPISGNTKR